MSSDNSDSITSQFHNVSTVVYSLFRMPQNTSTPQTQLVTIN